MASKPDIGEEQLLALYQQATSGQDPDKVEMILIADELRHMGVQLKRKAGTSSVGDGVLTHKDLQMASLAFTLFGKQERDEPACKFASKWRKAGMAARASSILMDLESLRGAE